MAFYNGAYPGGWWVDPTYGYLDPVEGQSNTFRLPTQTYNSPDEPLNDQNAAYAQWARAMSLMNVGGTLNPADALGKVYSTPYQIQDDGTVKFNSAPKFSHDFLSASDYIQKNGFSSDWGTRIAGIVYPAIATWGFGSALGGALGAAGSGAGAAGGATGAAEGAGGAALVGSAGSSIPSFLSDLSTFGTGGGTLGSYGAGGASLAGAGSGTIGSAFPSLYGSDSTLLTGGNMDWTDLFGGYDAFSDPLSASYNPGSFTTDPSLGSLGGDTSWWSPVTDPITGDVSYNWNPLQQGGFTTNPSLTDLGGNTSPWSIGNNLNPSTLQKFLSALTGKPLSALGNALGGNGGGLGTLLGAGLAAAPSLAAIAYAMGQKPADTSQLQSLYSQYSPQAQASQYDVNSDLGRADLTSSLARRGVMGSSFGDQALTNYGTTRDLGRNALINQGVGMQAGIANSIMGAGITNQQQKDDLLGRALLALSGGLSPRIAGGLLGGGN